MKTLPEVLDNMIDVFSLHADQDMWIKDLFLHPQNYTVLKYELINNGKYIDILLVVHNWDEHQPADKVIEVYNTLIPAHWISWWGEDDGIGEMIAERLLDSKLVI